MTNMEYLNARASIPITSGHKWDTKGHMTLLDEHGGITTNTTDLTDDPIICRNGVKFMKVYVDPHLVNQDVHRRGAR